MMSNQKRGKLNLELTNQCNFNCIYCPGCISKRGKEFIDYFLAKKVIHQVAKTNLFSDISFSSLGDPLLHPQILEIIKEAKQKDFTTFLATNGSLLNKNLILKLINTGLDFLVIGINAGSEREFQLRRSNLKFDDYLMNIVKIVQYCAGHSHIQVILSYITTKGIKIMSP